VLDAALWGLTAAVAFVLVISVVITVHELGHYWAGRLCGMKIDRFSLGFGPTLAMRKDKRGVEWRIAWLPLGGYVKFAGDANAAGVPDADDLAELREAIIARDGPGAERNYYHFKPVWQRAFVAVSGPLANFVLAIAIFAVTFAVFGDQVAPTRVETVEAGSPAAAAGFRPGDLILEANGETITDPQDFIMQVRLNSASEVPVLVKRGEQTLTLVVTPRRSVVEDGLGGTAKLGKVGMSLASARAGEIRIVKYGPLEAVGEGFKRTAKVLKTTLNYIGRMFTGKESGDQLSGPLGTATATGKLANASLQVEGPIGLKVASVLFTLVQLIAFLSVGVGFLNLLPIPVLDGGHLLFYAYESVARKPLAARVQEIGYQVGLALVVGLMLFATWNDLQKILGGPST
jgi:regulator of sigma E protease